MGDPAGRAAGGHPGTAAEARRQRGGDAPGREGEECPHSGADGAKPTAHGADKRGMYLIIATLSE